MTYLKTLPHCPLSMGFDALKLESKWYTLRSRARRARFLKADTQQLGGTIFFPYIAFVKQDLTSFQIQGEERDYQQDPSTKAPGQELLL